PAPPMRACPPLCGTRTGPCPISPMPTDSPAIFPDLTAELLRRGSCVRFRATGASMQPTIEDGEVITVAPVTPMAVKRGDILLYQNELGVFAHRVVRITGSGRIGRAHV